MKFPLFCILILFLLTGCATFPKEFKSSQPITKGNLSKLNGEFGVNALEDTIQNEYNIPFRNAYRKFYRGFGKMERDTFEVANLKPYSFSIEVLNQSELKISYLKNNIVFKKFNLEYKLKDDGYIYLKNRNLHISGIPFLLGGNDLKRLRLAVEPNNLIIEEVYHTSGGFIILFTDFKTWEYRNTYRRLN